MRTIIAGSRGIDDYDLVVKAVKESGFNITEVVSGGAKGVDSLGEKWAAANGINVERFIPDWDSYGKRAGVIRNEEMGNYAESLIAIWDGKSKGTKHMIDYARDKGLAVSVLNTNDATTEFDAFFDF